MSNYDGVYGWRVKIGILDNYAGICPNFFIKYSVNALIKAARKDVKQDDNYQNTTGFCKTHAPKSYTVESAYKEPAYRNFQL